MVIQTGLRFSNPQLNKPQWIRAVNCVSLPFPTGHWEIHADDGRPIGWAALDCEDRDTVDGNVDLITCILRLSQMINQKGDSIEDSWPCSSSLLTLWGYGVELGWAR
jgi:hypothetical protein